VVESLPSLEALIPLADQLKHNAPAKEPRLRKALSLYLGNPRRKEKNNGKEKENVF
jgi:hypothetical protein